MQGTSGLWRGLGVAVAAAALVVLSGSLAVAGGSDPAAISVVDRTFSCSIPVWGGIREAKLFGKAGLRAGPGEWRSLPNAALSAGSPYESLVWAAAGAPVPADVSSTLGLYTDLCKPAAARVPLSTNGLRGSVAGPYGDRYACEVPKEILVRLRAELRGPARLATRRSGGRPILALRAPVRLAQLAARTRSGRQVAYAQVLEGGTSRLFVSRGCYSDS